MGQSLSHRLSCIPWRRQGFGGGGQVVVIIIVAIGLSLALPAATVSAVTGLLGAVASIVVLTRRGGGGVLRRQA